MLLHLVASDIATLVVARALLGAGEGFFLVAALAAASDLAPASRRGEALSFLSLSLYLGLAVGPLLGETVLGVGDFGLVWLVTAAIAGLAVVLCVLVPETAPLAVAHAGPRPRAPIIHPAGLFPGAIILTGMWGMAGFFAFLPGYARQVGLGGASLPLLVYALIVVALRIVGARVPDRYGSIPVATFALTMAAVGLTIMGLIATPAGLIAGTAVFAIGIAFLMPAIVSLAVSRVPEEERGSVVGTTAVFLDIAFGIAPVAIGALAAGTGTGPTFFLSAAIAAVGALVLVGRRDALRRPVVLPAR
jgi:MFS family permease